MTPVLALLTRYDQLVQEQQQQIAPIRLERDLYREMLTRFGLQVATTEPK